MIHFDGISVSSDGDDRISSSSCFRFNTGFVVVVVSGLGGIIFGINANGIFDFVNVKSDDDEVVGMLGGGTLGIKPNREGTFEVDTKGEEIASFCGFNDDVDGI